MELKISDMVLLCSRIHLKSPKISDFLGKAVTIKLVTVLCVSKSLCTNKKDGENPQRILPNLYLLFIAQARIPEKIRNRLI